MIAALALVIAVQAPPRDSFPHSAHRRLFTACTTCHQGIVSGDSSATRPPTSFCGTCHDGKDQRLVDWTPRLARASNLRYDHRRHVAVVDSAGDSALACVRCHALPDTIPELMVVARARPERCITCHAHQAESHLAAAARCETCHRPIAEAQGLLAARIAAFPRPASHDSVFAMRHADAAGQNAGSCSVCHAREFCASCHANGERIAVIQAMAPDRRVADLVRAWRPRPASHAAPAFATDHRALAAAGDRTCLTCHTQRSCAACHDAASRPPFHPTNFVLRHQRSAWTQTNECAACHQTQIFCRDCHRQTGRATDAAAFGSYHTAQPNWRFGHAAAARRSIETCASCHAQSFCLGCHSARQGQGVSPHGPGFNPGMQSKNAAMCRVCHVTIPQ